MNYVGFGRRFVAAILDGLIIGAINFIIGIIVRLMVGSDTSSMLILNGISLIIGIGYVVVYQAKMSQTLGKKVMGIKVVNEQGTTPSMMTFFLRDVIGKLVSGFILGIGYLMVLWDSKKQALHDKIAGTYVIKV